jgi:uncharacterized membrane protein
VVKIRHYAKPQNVSGNHLSMSTPETKSTSSIITILNLIGYWFAVLITILIVSLFAYMNIDEFYTVAIIKSTKGYPWGEINENPWYYKSAFVYSSYMLVNALVFLTGLVIFVRGIVKAQKNVVQITILCLLLYLLLLFINGQSNHL